MQVIDTHQHFWEYDPARHEWISEEMSVIRRDFLPKDLQPLLSRNGVTGCVNVQVDQTEAETLWMLDHAAKHDFILGVVGWVDLRDKDIRDRLAYFSQFPKLKGFRHILQAEAPDFMLDPAFLNGMAALKDFGFTYDILIFPRHLPAVLDMVIMNQDQPFVINHLAKPYIRDNMLELWKKDMERLAAFPNVYCKVSGMVTEADWSRWTSDDLFPYLDTVVELFGMDRLMFGSDWPVCLVAAKYDQWLSTVRSYFSRFSEEDQHKLFNGNARRFYRL